ncbi:hypothetical protein ACFPRL_08915 [Pseudoclavibacter helvolus]
MQVRVLVDHEVSVAADRERLGRVELVPLAHELQAERPEWRHLADDALVTVRDLDGLFRDLVRFRGGGVLALTHMTIMADRRGHCG